MYFDAYLFQTYDFRPISTLFSNVVLIAIWIVFILVAYTEKLITKIQQTSLHEMEESSLRDTLTGINNRRFAEKFFKEEIKNDKGFRCFFCLIDIDNFKSINDTYGHNAGDLVLRVLGDVLSRNIRKTDLACRWGGEEFLIAMPGCGIETGLSTMERIRHDFENESVHTQSGIIRATITGGAAVMTDVTQSVEEILHIIDEKLYEGKRSGKNRIVD